MKIIQLSPKNLETAKKLLNKIFPVQTKKESSDFWLPASLDGSYKKNSPNKKVTFVKYWVGTENGKLIGTTGIYELKKDAKEANWLSWFCVHPQYRSRGIGSKLLDYAIKKAKINRKKYFRLYTSPDDPNEKAAQKLYEKKGFKITGKGKKRGKYKIVYRELKL